ncbi:MAG TPA: segregation/condensation protein A, partial [Polyangiaceae bacterium]|nr:segregation/condensation protein A [Polyangiaceae bacterium]
MNPDPESPADEPGSIDEPARDATTTPATEPVAGPGLAQTGHATRTIATPEGASADAGAAAPPGDAAPRSQAAPKGAAPTPEEPYAKDAYVVALPGGGFEGPLDLLLQIIQKHELNILDLPISFVTSKYLEYLSVMKELSIDVASEYLVMAATLAHIKSKMLLPEVPKDQDVAEEEEEEDPRYELVRRLLEYQKYKAAAEDLGRRDTLGNSVFPRGSSEPVPEGPAPFANATVFELLDAFSKVLSRTKTKIEHEVVFDRISISDRITELVDVMMSRRSVAFEELFGGGEPKTRFDLVITFLAVLEMCRMNMMRVFQTDALSPIHVELLVVEQEDAPLKLRTLPPDQAAAEAGPAEPSEPPVEEPPVEEPPVEVPPAEEPPVEAPPETPPVEAPPVEAPPVEEPAIEAPPVEAPP